MRKQILAAAIAAFVASPVAIAHEPGDVIFRVGVAHVSPDVDSGKISVGGTKVPGSKADVNSNTQLGLTASWMLAPHFGLEVLAATPFTHTVKVKGLGALDGKLGEVKHLPPTVSAQYFFLDSKSNIQPYVGLGLNYTWILDEKLKGSRKAQGFHDLSLTNSFGWAVQAGIDVGIADNLFVNAAIWRIDIDTKAKVKYTAANVPVKVNVELDPWVYFVGIGYKF